MERKAYAKVNLTLDITGRDERGYHLLSSVFAAVSLADTVSLAPGGIGITLECDTPGVPTDGTNLCCRAAEAFLTAFDLPERDFRIGLKKKIPMCAGLGGGSTDAAAVLLLLAEYAGISPDDPRLLSCAASLGADVPFFLRGGVCLAEGIGEKLTPLPALPEVTVLILRSGDGASTPQIYRRFDTDGKTYAPDTPPFLSALRAGRSPFPFVGNHLSLASQALCPEETRLKADLLRNGATAAEVTGSGSAVYGVFPSREAAEYAKRIIDAEFSELCVFE